MDVTDEKEPIDEDVLGHNQILLQRKKRLVSELTTLENEACVCFCSSMTAISNMTLFLVGWLVNTEL